MPAVTFRSRGASFLLLADGMIARARFTRFTRKKPSVKRYDCSPVYKGKKVEFVVFLV